MTTFIPTLLPRLQLNNKTVIPSRPKRFISRTNQSSFVVHSLPLAQRARADLTSRLPQSPLSALSRVEPPLLGDNALWGLFNCLGRRHEKGIIRRVAFARDLELRVVLECVEVPLVNVGCGGCEDRQGGEVLDGVMQFGGFH
jgi:hypothetical protein